MRALPVRWVLALALCVPAASCGAPDGPTSPDVTPQFAKGGKPGGGSSGAVATLDEFWVYRDAQGVEQVHMVVANADRITKNVIHDYFFNGVRDDDAPYDQHYEWSDPGAVTPAPTILEDGRAHVDLPFKGERTPEGDLYRDFLATSVDGAGDDPFVFRLSAHQGSTSSRFLLPTGVVVGGETLGPEAHGTFLGAGHATAQSDVRSYALFKGAPAEGAVWVSGLQLAGVTCAAPSGGGRGKKTAPPSGLTVAGIVTVDFDSDSELFEGNVWWEGHFAGSGGTLSVWRIASTQSGGTFEVSAQMPVGWSGEALEFVVDFVRSTDVSHSLVYDPARNAVTTTAGVAGSQWASPVQSVGDATFPVAHSGFVSVACGR